jgi:hypothetical protein
LSSHHSLNFWDAKPWWCQPWSILLTGVALISGSWLLLKILWITLGITLVILLWWTYFLILVPQYVREQGMLIAQNQSPADEFSASD